MKRIFLIETVSRRATNFWKFERQILVRKPARIPRWFESAFKRWTIIWILWIWNGITIQENPGKDRSMHDR